MNETFLLSNIAPQVGDGFNRHCITVDWHVVECSYSNLDWAYLEHFCRRLTSSFSDVFVFTIPLYLPKLETDGKWRVVSKTITNSPATSLLLDAWSHWLSAKCLCSDSLCKGYFNVKTVVAIQPAYSRNIDWCVCSSELCNSRHRAIRELCCARCVWLRCLEWRFRPDEQRSWRSRACSRSAFVFRRSKSIIETSMSKY